jgi:hypothetical protein
MALNGTGFVTVMGGSLHVTVQGQPYVGLAIRRLDGQADAAFSPFHQAPVTEADIKVFLPNWQNLNWTHHAAPFAGLPAESRADDAPYRVHLLYGGAAQGAAVVAQFVADLV